MLQLGKFDKRVTLQSPPVTNDALGQPIDAAWVDVTSLWADIRHVTGLEAIKADAPTSRVQASVRIWHRAGVNAGMRLVKGSAVYNIEAVLPSDGTFLDLVCEVINADS